MSVPIKNIYHMLAYAWDRGGYLGEDEVGAEDFPDSIDLLARALANNCSLLLRRGFDRGYREYVEETGIPRGKIDFSQTINKCTRRKGKVVCRVEEFTHDVLHNQILKTVVGRLIRTYDVNKKTVISLREVWDRMHEVQEISLDQGVFTRVRFHRNNAHYVLLLNICELIHWRLLPEEGTGKFRFKGFKATSKEMGNLFEDFVRNFLKAKLGSDYEVSKTTRQPQARPLEGSNIGLIPNWKTDVILSNQERYVIIETKFYRTAEARFYDVRKYISSHLFQLLAYLHDYALSDKRGEADPEGILLYANPKVGFKTGLYNIWGYRFRVAALDLNSEWREIEESLLQIANSN